MTPTPPPGFELIPPQAQVGAPPPPPPGFEIVQPQNLGQAVGEAGQNLGDELLGAIEGQAPQPGLGMRALGATGRAVGQAGVDLASGMNTGLAALLGLPVDAINASPMLLNLLPGDQGMTPLSANPRGGSEDWEAILNAPASAVNAVAGTDLTTMPEPQGVTGRVMNRVGQELGATVPFLGVGARLAAGGKALSEMTPLARHFAGPMRLDPVGATSREVTAATAAGVGAQASNEIFNGGEQGLASDVGGSIAGAGALSLARGAGGVARNLLAGATNSPRYMDELAGEAVADMLINNSSMMARQAEPFILKGQTPQLDTQQLVEALRRPADVERLVPGYTADVGTRTADPKLSTFAQDANARMAGAGNTRLANNNAAVEQRVGEMAPQGDPAQFRLDLQRGVDEQIASLVTEEELARAAADEAGRGVTPRFPHEAARGSMIRQGAQGAYDSALDEVSELYRAIDEGGYQVDPQGLVDRFAGVDQRLPVADADRFRPAGADVPGRLAERAGHGPAHPEAADLQARGDVLASRLFGDKDGRFGDASNVTPMPRGEMSPEETSRLFEEYLDNEMLSGQFRPDGTRASEPGVVPLREVTAIRSGLSNDMQGARAAGQPRQASVAGQYRDELDQYLAESLDPEAASAYEAANRSRFDVGQRFEEPHTALGQALKKDRHGGYVLDASALPRRFVQPDTGKISDYQALMREAGADPQVRAAIADQVMADAQPVLAKGPEAVSKFLSERNVVLGDFPELRQSLEDAGVKVGALREAETARTTTQRDLTTPGRSPEASYLRFSNDRTADSIRQVIHDPDPRAAARRLLETSLGDPADLRSAFWENVKTRGRNSATDISGTDVWNARKVRDLFNDPKTSAVAEELWKDNPDDLKAIREVFDALEAATPGKARAPGSSGTAQAVTGKLDPSLTATSLASRARSVKRGQMSLSIASIDVLSTWLRNKSTQVQSRAIDALAAQVVNNPGLAADLLEKHNPAPWAQRRHLLTQKYGARIGNLLTILDEANEEEGDGD